ncbi:tandem-95 repeat protein [[Phormidium] sp. ETS-05]|uniref:tandem-95 repeat protein n=1 Tax=[Phormidium] sp. ETS-05 TaxID=222819 RepID=UPI0018EF173B|nr:tandem-95 repeat protein [[Phormidium] sp. ETS-05]
MLSQSETKYNLLREKNQASAQNIQRQLVIIDAKISHYQLLAAGVTPGTEVVILHPAEDGIEQITAILSTGTIHESSSLPVSGSPHLPVPPLKPSPPAPLPPSERGESLPAKALTPGLPPWERGESLPVSPSPRRGLGDYSVHIISHGEPGSLQLGNTTLNSHNLSRYASQLYQWRKALGESGNLILYGCSVAAGSEGLSFIQQLHRILGSGIAAATTPVGNAALGGSWNLQQIYSPVPPSPHLPVSESPHLPFQPDVLQAYPGLFPAAFPITESFKNSTTTDPNWILGGDDPSSNGGGIARLTGNGTIDPAGDGWLRLTSPDGSNDADTGFAIYNDSFSSSNGIVINFDYASYGNTTTNGGDGFSFFLFDGSKDASNSSSFKIGVPPGGLGYANRISPTGNGLTGGYVGIGFDEFGNYSSANIGTGTNNKATEAITTDAVALRGRDTSASQNGTAGYELLAKKQVSSAPFSTNIDNVNRTNPREVQITIINNFIKVEMDFGSGAGLQEVINYNNLFSNNGNPPPNYKMGFSAGTGGANNYHEVRNLEVRQPVDLTITKTDNQASVNGGSIITYDIIVSNNNFNNLTGIQVADALTGLTGITWNASYTPGSGGPPSGNTTFAPTIDLLKGGSAVFQVTGTVSGTGVINLNSAATVTPPTGFSDVNLSDNSAIDPAIAKSGNEDNNITLTSAEFSTAFTNLYGSGSLSKIQIKSLPANGTLKLSGTNVTLNQEILVGNLGNLTFTPASNWNGITSFAWNGHDGTNYASTDATVSLTINPVNDRPSFTANTQPPYPTNPTDPVYTNPPTVDEDAGTQTITGWLSFNPGGGSDEANQTVSAYTVSASAISNPGLFDVGGTPAIDANGNLTYTPAPNVYGSSTFQVRVQDDGGTANGGVDTSVAQTFTITVNPINDAPVLDNTGSPSLTAIDEDVADASNTGTLVSAIIGTSITDVDTSPLQGIAVTGADNTNGTWQYSINNGSTWIDFVTPSDASATLLNPSAKIRFVPNADYYGTVPNNITFRAWDQTSGNNGDTVPVSANGGTTAFSTATETASITVNPINDIPSFTASDPPAVNEDAGPQTLTGWASGFNPGPANESTQTALGYTVSNISNPGLFSSPPTVAANGQLTYTPAPGVSGTSDFQVVVQDSGGTANGGVDTSIAQPFTITVNPINDAPVLDNTGSPSLTAIDEDVADASNTGTLVSAIIGTSITDVDTSPLQGIAVTGADNTNGTWQYSINNGSTWTDFGTLSDTSATLLNPSAKIRFLPNLDYNGTVTNGITFRAWDQTSDSNGNTGVDVSTNGGTTAFSTAKETASITVNPVNDIPSFTAANPPAVDEDAGPQTIPGWVTLFNPGPANESTQTALGYMVSNISNPGLFSSPPTVAPNGQLTYTPEPGAFGSSTFRVVVQDNGGTANGGVDTSVAQTFTITVNSVNDPPTSADKTVAVTPGTPYAFKLDDFPFNDVDGDPPASITITDFPGPGTLLFNGQPVTPGQVIPADQIGLLTFTPAAGSSGTNPGFQFTVSDGQGNSTPATMTLNVGAAVNNPPTSGSNTVAVTPDTPYTFSAADFPFNDVDGDSLASITISQLPGAGTLLFNGQPVTAGQIIPADQIGLLTFAPAAGSSGTNPGFQFTVSDGQGSSQPATMNLNVGAVNNPPTSADKTVTLNEDSSYSFLETDFAFTDTDGGNFTSIKITSLPTAGTLQLGTTAVNVDDIILKANIGTLKFTPAANANGTNYANFQFTVNDGTGDSTTANTITLDVTPVNDKPSFTASEPPHISFNAGAQNVQNWAIFNPGAANEVGQTGTYTVNPTSITNPSLFAVPPAVDANGNLTYTPAPGASGTSDFQVVVQDNGGTANGGVDTSDSQTFTITVNPEDAPANNAPNFTGNATLTPPVAQDSTNPPSATVSNLFGGLFSDPDSGDSLSGIAVVGNTADPVTEGSWQYSPDGINWFDIGTVGDGPNALALSATSFIRFFPVPGYNGTPQPLTVRAVDNTYTGGFSGLNRANIDTSNPGGNSPIAGSTNTIRTSVAAVVNGTDNNDTLDGGDGNDAITGGLGNDSLTGNDGDDAIDGGDGQDIISGGPGDDSLSGSNDNDTVSGGDNNDTISGGNGDDSLDGGVGDDSLTGGDGDDTLIGGGGGDTLSGGNNDDVYVVDLGDAPGTVISDASGNDKLVLTGGTLTLDEPPGVQVIRQGNNLVVDLNGNGVQDDDADIVIVDFFDPEGGPGSGFIEELGNLSGTDVVNSLGGTTPPPPPPPPEEEPGTGLVTPANPIASTDNNQQASPDIVAPEMDCTAPEMDCTCPTIPPPPTVSYEVPMMDPSLAGDDVIFGGAGGDLLLGYTGNDYLQGNGGNDTIIGGNGSEQPIGGSGDQDVLFGNTGNDILQGSEGKDIIYAGQDDDIAHGGKDDDLMYGDRGSDILMGDLGNDVMFGGPGEPELADQDATDYLYGGAGDDFLNGNQGDDFLSGGVGNDTIYGGQNNDIARGEEGNDLLFGDKGNDTFCGGDGDDTLYGGTGSDIGIGDSGEQDKLLGGAGNDFINGNEGNDSICGGDGNDTIYGGKDNDVARGEEGNDLLFGDKGNDTISGGNGDDTLYGGTGSDIGIGDSGEQDKLLGGAGNDFINGNEGKDTICGGDGNDTIYGGKDDDLINGHTGDDFILGDLGNDTITGGDGRDTFVLRAGAGSDIIIDFTDGVDFLGLSGGLSFADLSISGDANATLIKFGDELLATLGGVNFSLINEADFSLV